MTKSSKVVIEKRIVTEKERMMRPTEWAREDRIDPCLFAWWEKQLMTRKEYEEIKKKVIK